MPKANQKRIAITAGPPPRPPSLETRTTDLIGLTADGRMVFWRAAALVRPISAFPVKGIWISTGHYVIEWKGHAITVHCGNRSNGSVGIQFMAGGLGTLSMPREEVEDILLGEVVRSEATKAESQALIADLLGWAERSYDAPHLQRGKLV